MEKDAIMVMQFYMLKIVWKAYVQLYVLLFGGKN